MRGFVHEQILLAPLQQEAHLRGADTGREVATGSGRRCGYVDLVIECDRLMIAVEAELSSRRVANDLTKAMAIGADELWIVVPAASIARAAARVLRQLNRPAKPAVFVLTVGQALHRIRNRFPLICGS